MESGVIENRITGGLSSHGLVIIPFVTVGILKGFPCFGRMG